MAEQNTFADYAAKNERWRKELHIPPYAQYADQLDIARQVIDDLSMEDPEKYEQFVAEALEAGATEEDERESAAPLSQAERIKQELRDIAPGTYLMLHGHYGNAINATIEQGKLVSVDWERGTVKLHSTVYNNDLTVRIDQISYIDASRSGSGARGSVQQADLRRVGNDWYRGSQKL
ncbi:hypothetical protein [Janthinobacterium agaricidamnosum]|uniref:Uncharacterized protein n=1 Tax=Janthinobacterium agaricidamnosum NBRC 102515 = DSM 9628 TaxID=1349767 RepID=W0V0X6_9BURK|nr:hypothetical protein [Janthinobacterium agaricidamnosum]CDG82464.1 hypothetical protein GJA_1828 [Janthinobacterium agaricidamnosum NBRC 102515 = DSM 9628]